MNPPRPDPATPRAHRPGGRLILLDAARGVAVIAMAIYHFSWDLANFGYLSADVESALAWRIFARSIAGTFVFIVGVSLVLASRRGIDWPRFLRRVGLVAFAALAITAVTWVQFPYSFIFFGVLHHIALASVLGLAFMRLPVVVVILAAGLSLALPLVVASPVFDAPALVWLGLGTMVPRTNDFVPLFPWFGIVLAGIAAARLWRHFAPRPLQARLAAASAPPALLWTGRNSLAIYLAHQPILYGLVALAAFVAPPDRLDQYVADCNVNCVGQEVEAGICERFCACAVDKSQQAGLWEDIMRNSLSPEA